MTHSRRTSRSAELDGAAAPQERREPGPVVIQSDSDFVRCPNRSCSALLPLDDEEQICGYCGRWTGPLGQ